MPIHRLPLEETATWERLVEMHPHLASPFYSPDYAIAVGRCLPFVSVCVLRQGSESVGFLPFQFRTSWHRAIGAAERVGSMMTDAFGLIAAPNLRVSEQQLLQFANLRALSFTHLLKSQLEHGLPGEQPTNGFHVRLHSGYWSELETAKRGSLREVRRLGRQLERDYGPIRFCFHDSNWESGLDHLFERKGQQYIRTGRQNLFSLSWTRQLLRKLAPLHKPTCKGVFSTLYAGDTWVASHFGLQHTNTLHYWFPVYNTNLKHYAPGRQLELRLLEAAPGEGINVIDHGEGDTHAKRFFANREYSLYRGMWVQSGLRSFPARLTFAVEWRLDARASAQNGSFKQPGAAPE